MYQSYSNYLKVESYFSGKDMNFNEIKKEIEKGIIRNAYAPALLNKSRSLKKKYDTAYDDVIKSMKENVKLVQGQIDSSMKGTYSTKVVEKLEENIAKFDQI